MVMTHSGYFFRIAALAIEHALALALDLRAVVAKEHGLERRVLVDIVDVADLERILLQWLGRPPIGFCDRSGGRGGSPRRGRPAVAPAAAMGGDQAASSRRAKSKRQGHNDQRRSKFFLSSYFLPH